MNRNTESAPPSAGSDCRWFESTTEGFFAGALSGADLARFESHGASCAACAANLGELRSVDPLMKDLLRYRMALAQGGASARSSRIHWGRMTVLAGAVTGVVVLGAVLWPSSPAVPAPPPVVEVRAPLAPPAVDKDKDTDPPATKLLKPEKNEKAGIGPAPQQDSSNEASNELVDFALIDAAGQVWTPKSYRGRFFLFGVLPPAESRAAANLERLYRTFGAEIRLVAVLADRRSPAPPNTTFPTFLNSGSKLLGARESEFVLLDPAGEIALRGSLTADVEAVTQSVRSALQTKKR